MTSTLHPLAYTQQINTAAEKTTVTYSQLFYSWFPISQLQEKLCSDLYSDFYYAVRLIDDVQDETNYRNGKPTSNIVFGIPLTINAGMLATVQLMQRILEFKNDKVTEVFLDEFKLMWEAQGEQLKWNKDRQCPSLEELANMSIKKGVLVTLFGRILCALCGKDESGFLNMFRNFNLLLQVENDMDGTASLRDVTEGQYNFVTSYAIQQELKLKGSNKFEQILLSKTNDEKSLNEARNILIETESFEFCYEFRNKLLLEIIAETKRIGGNNFCEELLITCGGEKLHTWGKDLDSVGEKLHTWGKDLDSVGEKLHTWGKDLDSVGEKLHTWGKDLDSVSKKLHTWGKELDSNN